MRVLPLLTSAAAVVVAAGVLAGCGGQDLTQPKLQRDVAATFLNLLATQDRIEGKAAPRNVHASAHCLRAGSTKSVGPGKDWRCTIAVSARPEGPPLSVRYALTARANACYTATRADFKQQQIRSNRGALVKNPLYIFDGCLSA